MGELATKMKRCTTITEGDEPQLSRNTIIIGNSSLYCSNFERIQHQATKELEAIYGKKLGLNFLKGIEDIEEMFTILKKEIYSYLVVFEPGKFLEDVKRILREKNFHHRVQLTNIPEVTEHKHFSEEEEIDRKIKYLKDKIKFKIKFEIAPLKSIHIYKPRKE